MDNVKLFITTVKTCVRACVVKLEQDLWLQSWRLIVSFGE